MTANFSDPESSGRLYRRLPRFFGFQAKLWPMVNHRVWKHNALSMSSALAFQTLFALLPILVLTVLLLKSLGAIGDPRESLREFLNNAGIARIYVRDEPDGNQRIQQISLSDKIEELYTRLENKITVGRVGPIGVILLIWTSVAPLAHGVLWLGPVVVGILILGAVYKFLPNTAVPYRTALVGAVAALPLWMVARWGFGLYIGHAAKANVYGALGLLPVFLFWMNLSWFIFLFGAEFAYTAANLDRLEGTRHYDETIRQNVRRVIDRAQTALKDLSLADLVKNGGREQK